MWGIEGAGQIFRGLRRRAGMASLAPRCGTQVTPGQVSCSERTHSGAVLRPRGCKALRQCRPQPVTYKALVCQQVQDLPESFRHGAALTRDLAQIKGAEIQQV
ncbi:hypothetical protein DNW11_21735 [Salmonella enterica subsp. enterica serovar Jodhpur]|nr:hypothetical protein [Salmonella enterica subsp. enterica serovar Jodhpur]